MGRTGWKVDMIPRGEWVLGELKIFLARVREEEV